MDKYTKKTKIWLDERFKMCDKDGIYQAYSPIYGFRKGHCDGPSYTNNYNTIYQIIKALSHLKFSSILDAGGAEGHKSYLIKQLFGVKVKHFDLSEEACKRAKEIFGLDSMQGDIQNLPFMNDEFDVVLCVDTLEHVPDVYKALGELLRVAKKAVVIILPHQSEKIIKKIIEDKIPHGHIHSFDLDSFNFLKQKGYHVISRKFSITLSAGVIIDAERREWKDLRYNNAFPKKVIDLYNVCVPIFRKIFGRKSAAFLIRLDYFLSNFVPFYSSQLFIILKDEKCYTKEEIKNISPSQIMDFVVPYHYLNKK